MDEILLRAVAGIGALLLASAIPIQVLRSQPPTLYSLGIAVAAVFLGAAAAGQKVDFSYADGTITAKMEQLEKQVEQQQAAVSQVQAQTNQQANRIEGLQQNVRNVQSSLEPLKVDVANNQLKVDALLNKVTPLINTQSVLSQKVEELSTKQQQSSQRLDDFSKTINKFQLNKTFKNQTITPQ
jgi:hypothetical protein